MVSGIRRIGAEHALGGATEIERHLSAVEERESKLRALIGFDAAAARGRAAAAGDGPLGGWALGVKDLIDVAGLPTRCGVNFLGESPVERSAGIVTRLESAGAYIFSKTVTTGVGYFDPGATTNPWNPSHTPGGSSMGSAAGTAAGLVRIALGAQTTGSIIRPAAYCGVVGFKPSYGRLPLDGVFSFSWSVDTLGFFARNVCDLRAVWSALEGPEPEATFSERNPLRIGVVYDLLSEPACDEMTACVEEVARACRERGSRVGTARLPESLRKAYPNHAMLIAGEFAQTNGPRLRPHRELLSPRVRELLAEGEAISPEQLRECRKRRHAHEAELVSVFDEFDLLLTPSSEGAAPKGLEATGDPRMSLLFTHARLPSISLPAGLDRLGLPLGVQFVAPRGQDERLLRAAGTIEGLLQMPPCRVRGS